MNRIARSSVLLLLAGVMVVLLGACAGGGSPSIRYSVGMGYNSGYYGRAPYGYYRPPDVVYVPDDAPVAMPLPEPGMDFGMPDAGFDDFGDIDF